MPNEQVILFSLSKIDGKEICAAFYLATNVSTHQLAIPLKLGFIIIQPSLRLQTINLRTYLNSGGMSRMGRLHSVTIGRFQESEFNGSFPAMSLKSRRSPTDPNPSYDFLQSGRMPKHGFSDFASTKLPFVTSSSWPNAGIYVTQYFSLHRLV